MFEDSTSGQDRDDIGDWVLRAGVALSFVLFGLDKFPSGQGAPWVRFFDQVGIGQWFRYFTGVAEIAGAGLVLYPATTRVGIAILATIMALASLIHVFIIRQPANGIITGALCLGLIAFWRRMGKK